MEIVLYALALIGALSLLRLMFFSFKSQDPSHYGDMGPKMDIQTHLNGDILCEGVIYGPTGRVTSSFVADMHGEWSGETGTLSEDFRYSSGVTQARKWFMTRISDTRFTATADDIIGTAEGEVVGSAIRMKYKIILPESSGGHKLNVTDWLYLTEDGAIINRSEMRMFGIKVAELVATMRPAESAAQQLRKAS